MNRSRINTILSPVYILITLLLIYTAAAQAQDAAAPATEAAKEKEKEKEKTPAKSDRTDEEKCQPERAKEAYKTIVDACSEGGFETSNCFTKIAECGDELEAETYTDTSALWKAIGINMPLKQSRPNQGKTFCPKVAGKTFMERRKDYTDDLRDLDADLADLKREIAEQKEELSKGLQEIADEVKEAQETLEKDTADLSEKRREQLTAFNEQQDKTAQDQSVKEMELLKLEGDLVNVNRKLVTEMIGLTEQAANRSCLSAIRKMRDEIIKLEGQANTVQKSKERKQNLILSYNDCMKTYDQRRTALMENNKQENDRINKTVQSLKSDLENQQNALKAAQTQLDEIKEETAKRISNAEQRFTSLSNSAQSRMMSLNQTSKEKSDALEEKKAKLEADRNELNNTLTSMGKMPEDPEATLTAGKVLSKADSGLTELENLCASEGCTKFIKKYCDALKDDKSAISRKKLNNARGAN